MTTLTAGLIGSHISRTRLPKALEIMCDLYGISLNFSLIDTAHLASFDLAATVDGLREKDWAGVTVTHPYKSQAADYADDGMRDEVSGLGAANTLVFSPERVEGFNTDYTGFLSAWRMRMGNQTPGRVAMAGAGGVARALGPALAELGADELTLWDMDEQRAKDLARAIGSVARAVDMDEAEGAIIRANGLVNATPMGMLEYPGSAFDQAYFDKQDWAFDAVYTPSETRFMVEAEAAGIRSFSGFDLFQHMAIRSFEAYTGHVVDPVEILPKLEELKP